MHATHVDDLGEEETGALDILSHPTPSLSCGMSTQLLEACFLRLFYQDLSRYNAEAKVESSGCAL